MTKEHFFVAERCASRNRALTSPSCTCGLEKENAQRNEQEGEVEKQEDEVVQLEGEVKELEWDEKLTASATGNIAR